MPKRLREKPIYIAAGILGYRNENYEPVIIDERIDKILDPSSIDDKIYIYIRQVEEWFLNHAKGICRNENADFVVVMIATSYIEGVEQYRAGSNSENRSRLYFANGMKRIFGIDEVSNRKIDKLYKHLRCGLFHNGMSGDAVVLNQSLEKPIDFSNHDTIDINPKLFLDAIIQDFQQYSSDLQNPNNMVLRDNFNRMFTVI